VEYLLFCDEIFVIILGLNVHYFISYCYLLRRYSFIFSICLSFVLLFMMLD
jgi:hypothetical protein